MSKPIYDINFYDLCDKRQNNRDMIEYMFDRTQSMFKWNNLPKTIPQRSLELYLQFQGFVLFVKHNDEYCIYYGGLGGEPDYLYRPTLATIANPAQRFDAQIPIAWEIDENTSSENDGAAVICLNDPLLKGLLPLHQKYASQLSENELTLWLTDILTRMPWLLSAQDDKTKESAEHLLKNIFEGKLGVVTDSVFLDGLKEHILNNSNHQSLGALMQLHQYYKASWYNELGLNAMQNQFKKEAISDSEQQMNTDTLTPFIDIMLKCRQEFCDNVNELFGLDISVELDSAWKDNKLEEESALENDSDEINIMSKEDTEKLNKSAEDSLKKLKDEFDNAFAEYEKKELSKREKLSENEVEESENEENIEEEQENEEIEQNDEETTDNIETEDIEETIENIDEKVDEILDEIKDEEPENTEEDKEEEDE